MPAPSPRRGEGRQQRRLAKSITRIQKPEQPHGRFAEKRPIDRGARRWTADR